ncbi:MAG: peptidoglycan DD-metalloendopeptidase family protein [Clostridia bacterium]|nr:peptidoglycan DD-metalloendopeptidase family protein [Clostridia bacterium]
MLEYIFKAILITSLIGTAATLFLTIIKPITRRCFSSRWNYYVWLVVLIAMIMPFRFTVPTSTQHSEAYFYSPVQELAQDEVSESNEENILQSYGFLESLMLFIDSQMDVFAMIWISGVSLLFFAKITAYGLFLIKLRRSTDVISCPELNQFTDKNITTRVGEHFSSPLMVGIFKHTLLLPKVLMTDEQLNNVLSHEMIHFKRKDILYKWFVSVVKCVHWFNPVIYYISKQVDIECEISCDTEVIKDMTDEEQTRYIDTIITLIAAGNKKPATITTGMVSDKKTLQRRFTMIKNKMKVSKKAMVISIALVLAVIGGTVFASGVLNGKLVEDPEDEAVMSGVKDTELKDIETETGKIKYDADSGNIVSAVSEPKLVADEQSKKALEPNTAFDAVVNEHEEVAIQEINIDSAIENPVDGEILSRTFGKRVHPITKEVREHNGVDIKAPEGADVVSSITGTVTDVGFDSEKGNYIVVENGNVKTLYAQLATTKVKKGDEIAVKQSIGTVGKTGNATGAHLHFEIMVDGEYVDPSAFIK